MQTGSGGFSEIVGNTEEFIVKCIEYIIHQEEETNTHIVDFLTDVFTKYLQIYHEIDDSIGCHYHRIR